MIERIDETNATPAPAHRTCPECEGNGVVGDLRYQSEREECPKCHGYGKVRTRTAIPPPVAAGVTPSGPDAPAALTSIPSCRGSAIKGAVANRRDGGAACGRSPALCCPTEPHVYRVELVTGYVEWCRAESDADAREWARSFERRRLHVVALYRVPSGLAGFAPEQLPSDAWQRIEVTGSK